jgi:hypothetical protein
MILGLIGDVVNGAMSLGGKFIEGEQKKVEFEVELQKVVAPIREQAIALEKSLVEAKSKIIQMEGVGSWLQRNWRPISMLTMMLLVVLEALGVLSNPLPDYFGKLFQIGLGGYVVGRSVEKIAPSISEGLSGKNRNE